MSRTLKLFLVVCGGAVATASYAAQLAALKAAGLSGIAPRGGNAFVGLVRTLQDNWTWLISTGLGLVLALIAGLMIAGSRQAPDWLFRVIGGIMLILVVIPAALAWGPGVRPLPRVSLACLLTVTVLLAAPGVALADGPHVILAPAILGPIGHAIGGVFHAIAGVVLGGLKWTVGVAGKFILATLGGLIRLLIPRSWA